MVVRQVSGGTSPASSVFTPRMQTDHVAEEVQALAVIAAGATPPRRIWNAIRWKGVDGLINEAS